MDICMPSAPELVAPGPSLRLSRGGAAPPAALPFPHGAGSLCVDVASHSALSWAAQVVPLFLKHQELFSQHTFNYLSCLEVLS